MSHPVPDYYAILGVAPHSSAAEITRAYRALLRQHHPDSRPPSAADDGAVRSDTALQHVLAAYAVLRDPKRRADYDHRRVRAIPVRHGREHKPPNADSSIVVGPVRWQPPRFTR
jgi:curved DNA-binding protein CbpA